jgi:hypothetical protein
MAGSVRALIKTGKFTSVADETGLRNVALHDSFIAQVQHTNRGAALSIEV